MSVRLQLSPVHRYAASVVEVALALHGHASGTSDPMADAMLKEYIAWLRWRVLDGWIPTASGPAQERFDNAVHDLANAALAEVL